MPQWLVLLQILLPVAESALQAIIAAFQNNPPSPTPTPPHPAIAQLQAALDAIGTAKAAVAKS